MRECSLVDLLGRALNEVESKNALAKMYATGPMDIPIPGPRVAIIGTRNPTKDGIDYAQALAQMLARQEVVIVSGLALGIDAAAHRAAMYAEGKTMVVIGTPPEVSYPRQNATLQWRIEQDHLVVFQFPPARR